MRICVFGAGAIGGHLAARLARGGAAVSVVARGAQLDAIRARGLRVQAPDGTLECRPAASDDPAALGPQDAVIVTTKAPALPGVAAAVAPLLGPDTAVAFVMNGIPWWYFDGAGGPLEGSRLPAVDPGDAVRRAVGVARTIGGVVYSSCTVVEPGVVHVENPANRVILGEPDGGSSPRAEAIAAHLRQGGLDATVVPDIRREVWAKLMGNLTSGPLAILSRSSMRDTYADPAVRLAAERIGAETAVIAAALGLDLGVDPAERIARGINSAHKPSILQDLELGRPMEVAALFDAPLAIARRLGVETPALDFAIALARRAATAAGLYAPADPVIAA